MIAEEITLPARFLTMTGHLIAVLTLLFDLDNVVERALPAMHSHKASQHGKQELLVLSALSLFCFTAEYVGTFLGISLFLPRVTSLYIFLHFIGSVFVALFLSQHWALGTYVYLFLFCSLVPALVEMILAFAIFKLKLMEYS